LNINRDKAVEWFVKACYNDPRIAACHPAVYIFNACFVSHREQLEPIIKSMVSSNMQDVAQEGAEEITARWLFQGCFQKDIEDCRGGSIPQRKGVAQTVAHFILKPEYSKACRPLLEQFLNDPERDVRIETNLTFRDKKIFSVSGGTEIIQKYIKSEAFKDDPTWLFYAIDEYAGSLLPLTDLILNICGQFAGPLRDATRDYSTGIAGDARRILPILLRLYEQAQEAKDTVIINRCLDSWDLLYEKRVGAVREMTQALDL
jgi:hypothetical protein